MGHFSKCHLEVIDFVLGRRVEGEMINMLEKQRARSERG